MSLLVRTRSGRVCVARPNWRSAVTVVYQFKTGVLASYDETEQRESLRTSARVRVDYQSILTTRMMTRWVADRQDPMEPLAVVATWRRVPLTTAVSTGDTMIAVPVPAWIVPGSFLILSSDTHEELVEVGIQVGSNHFVLTTGTQFGYSEGDAVHLAYLMMPQAETDFVAETDTTFTGQLSFDVLPGTDPQGVAAATTWPLFESLPVFDRQPNWRSRPRIAQRDSRSTFDPGRGTVLNFVPVERLRAVNKYGFSGLNAEVVDDLIAFFLARRGKRGSFWMPSHVRDLEVLSATGTTITVAGREAFDAFSGRSSFNCVAVQDRATGVWEPRRITAWALAEGNSQATLSAPLAVVPEAASKVSWLHLCRFAVDQLQVRYLTDSVAEVEYAIESLKNEAV